MWWTNVEWNQDNARKEELAYLLKAGNTTYEGTGRFPTDNGETEWQSLKH